MEKITNDCLDIAKHVFQVHGIDASGAWGSGRLRRCEVLAFFASFRPP